MNELRYHQRFTVYEDFRYKFNTRISQCRICNVSEGGMLIKVPQIFDIHDKIDLLFDHNDYDFSVIHTEVKHVNKNYIGVKYTCFDHEDRCTVKNFISNTLYRTRTKIAGQW